MRGVTESIVRTSQSLLHQVSISNTLEDGDTIFWGSLSQSLLHQVSVSNHYGTSTKEGELESQSLIHQVCVSDATTISAAQ